MNKDSAAGRTHFPEKKVFSVCGVSAVESKMESLLRNITEKSFRHGIASVAKGAINVSKIATVNFTSYSTERKPVGTSQHLNGWISKKRWKDPIDQLEHILGREEDRSISFLC